VIDVLDGERHAGQTVVVDGNRIAAIGASGELAIPECVRVVDAGGCT
jgi:hypothetical protein